MAVGFEGLNSSSPSSGSAKGARAPGLLFVVCPWSSMADGWQHIVIEGEDLYYNATTGETSVVIPDDPVADAYAQQPASRLQQPSGESVETPRGDAYIAYLLATSPRFARAYALRGLRSASPAEQRLLFQRNSPTCTIPVAEVWGAASASAPAPVESVNEAESEPLPPGSSAASSIAEALTPPNSATLLVDTSTSAARIPRAAQGAAGEAPRATMSLNERLPPIQSRRPADVSNCLKVCPMELRKRDGDAIEMLQPLDKDALRCDRDRIFSVENRVQLYTPLRRRNVPHHCEPPHSFYSEGLHRNRPRPLPAIESPRKSTRVPMPAPKGSADAEAGAPTCEVRSSPIPGPATCPKPIPRTLMELMTVLP